MVFHHEWKAFKGWEICHRNTLRTLNNHLYDTAKKNMEENMGAIDSAAYNRWQEPRARDQSRLAVRWSIITDEHPRWMSVVAKKVSTNNIRFCLLHTRLWDQKKMTYYLYPFLQHIDRVGSEENDTYHQMHNQDMSIQGEWSHPFGQFGAGPHTPKWFNSNHIKAP